MELTPGDTAVGAVLTVGTEFLACLRALLALAVPLRGGSRQKKGFS